MVARGIRGQRCAVPYGGGTPQGGIASPVLANLALDGLEEAVYSALGPNKTSRKPAKAHVVRYADDFIVTGVSRELLEQRVKPAVEEFLAVRGLQLAPEKTLISAGPEQRSALRIRSRSLARCELLDCRT